MAITTDTVIAERDGWSVTRMIITDATALTDRAQPAGRSGPTHVTFAVTHDACGHEYAQVGQAEALAILDALPTCPECEGDAPEVPHDPSRPTRPSIDAERREQEQGQP